MNQKPGEATIVIAEDDDDDYFLTERALQDCRFSGQIRRVKDGQELLDLLQQAGRGDPAFKLPLLLLLDLNMPRKDGREALGEIKADARLRMLPIVVLTTSLNEADVSETYRLGASTFIRKPESFEKFQEIMATLKKFWLEVAELPASPFLSGVL